MFEKEAEEYVKHWIVDEDDNALMQEAYKDGAEFGYNKGFEFGVKSNEKVNQIVDNEWHYVKDEGTPKVEGHYLVCLRNKDRDIFDCWIYYDKDVGWYSMKVRMKDIYAWKEIVLPELPKESEQI